MENRRVILDSNVFIAFYSRDDSLHDEALALLSELEDYEILVPYCVIQEVATILTYHFGKSLADCFIRDLEDSDNIFLIQADLHSAMDFFLSQKKKLSFIDFTLLHLAQLHQASLLTFDKQLHRLYKNSL